MLALKADIITQLKKDILALQGFRPFLHSDLKIDLGSLNSCFPNSRFPLGVNHEFICRDNETLTASSGFIVAVLSSLLKSGGAIVWVSSEQIIFPPALVSFGIDPSQFIFIRLRNQKQMLWTIEEAMKCEGLTAVIGEIRNIDLTISRRLQLASEQSGVTGFLLRNRPKQLLATACVCRWQIQHLQSETNGLPGIGFPQWNVELLKVRNGKTGHWQLEWMNRKFKEVITTPSSSEEQHKHAV
jgi:protein ImuA